MSILDHDTAPRAPALLIACLMLAVIAASAWLRLGRPQEPCGLWPLCRIEHVRVSDIADETLQAPLAPAVRAVHRAAASLALPVIVILLVTALTRTPRDGRTARGAALLLAVALGLAVLGVLAGGSRAVPVVLGNLLGGFAMLAGAWCLLPWAGNAAREDLRPAARLALTAWLLQIGLGALSGLLAPGYAGGAHLAWALVAAGMTARVARRAQRAGLRGIGTALLALVAAQWIVGGISALLGAPPALVVIHNLSAAAGLAVLAGLSWPRHPR
jgi:cytochrome c oxidase assembly protein subunit 15